MLKEVRIVDCTIGKEKLDSGKANRKRKDKNTMNKEKIKEIVKKCNQGIDQAEIEISQLSVKEIMELKAKLKGSNVHLDKWIIILIPFISLAISTLAVIIGIPGVDKIKIGIVTGILIVLAGAGYVIHIRNQFVKEEDLIALSYLEEYENFSKKLESYEQIEKRQKDERKQLLKEWKKKEAYVNEQVNRLNESVENKSYFEI